MKIKYILTLAVGLMAVLQTTNAADLTGVVSLKGTPPPEREVTPIRNDPNCSALYPGALPTTHFYVAGKKGELADVVVMLKGGNFKSTGASAAPAVLDQKGALYVPQIIAIQTGQLLIVKNSDPFIHNVHTVPKENPEANLAQMAGGEDLKFTFNKPESFLKFQCDVHPWMFAWVTVVDHPYFAVTDKDGKYTIKDVPPGKYTVTALHRKLAPAGVEQPVEVKADGAQADFTLEVKK